MIVLPCPLPLAFVIVPLSMGKGATKGFGIALAFGLGVALTLSMYGVIAAIVGEVAIGTIGAPLETVKNWLYLVAGIFAYIFALGELGLIRFRMPSYSGAAPAFIQRQSDFFKALLLGLFLGNIGVGCPHPATPVILTRIAASGDVFYGWLLFFTHAVGRVLPLLLLALLAIMGVNALTWLVARKDKIERATGWGMVFVAGFILVLGLFTHDWWVNSGQHTLLEEITQEERFIGVIADKLGVAPPHQHGLEEGPGLLGLPLWLGNWALALLWILPMWWYYLRKLKVKDQNVKLGVAETEEIKIEARVMPYRFWLIVALSVLLILLVTWVLPDRFLNHTVRGHMSEEQEEQMPHIEEHGGSLYHEEADIREGLSVNLSISPAPVVAGSEARLDFLVNEKPGNILIPVTELELDHTKLMHVIGVREDLNEFFHIHPGPTQTLGVLSMNFIFKNSGRYKIWTEVKKDGVNHAFGHPEIFVTGDGSSSQKLVDFARNKIVGSYQVSVKFAEPVVKGREVDLYFDIHTLAGQEVEVEDFIGAPMHLTIIKDDLRQFIHAHPEGSGHTSVLFFNEALAHGREPTVMSGADETLNFHVTFPEPGLYKAFAQFRPQGIDLPQDEALTAEFWIQVEEKSPLFISEWWLYLIISLVLMFLLSWGVNKYLSVKR